MVDQRRPSVLTGGLSNCRRLCYIQTSQSCRAFAAKYFPPLPPLDEPYMVRRLSCKNLVDGEVNRLSLGARLGCAAAGLLLLALLAVAAGLSPPRTALAWGTHRQLGLPECRFQSQWQMRCPSCGMTTAWAHAVRGQIHLALADNVAGALLALAALAAAPWTLLSACQGRWVLFRWRWSCVLSFTALLWMVNMADWLLRLALA